VLLCVILGIVGLHLLPELHLDVVQRAPVTRSKEAGGESKCSMLQPLAQDLLVDIGGISALADTWFLVFFPIGLDRVEFADHAVHMSGLAAQVVFRNKDSGTSSDLIDLIQGSKVAPQQVLDLVVVYHRFTIEAQNLKTKMETDEKLIHRARCLADPMYTLLMDPTIDLDNSGPFIDTLLAGATPLRAGCTGRL
jgi:hypothetical protein